MARKKSQENQHRKKIINSSPDQTSRADLTPTEPMENLHISLSSHDSTPSKEFSKAMELTLPTSSNSSIPGTPQEFTSQTTQISNCRNLLYLTRQIATQDVQLKSNKILMQALTGKGHPGEPPFLMETYQRFKKYKMERQQLINELSFLRPCDTPDCTIHATASATPVNDNLLYSPLIKTSTKCKENEEGFTSPI
ncbi:hypothetical protein TNCV_4682361 [Trichonephila clavipes]|nr:hypothetical protein TNCV_4682361 [Trichonephila clavipes]